MKTMHRRSQRHSSPSVRLPGLLLATTLIAIGLAPRVVAQSNVKQAAPNVHFDAATRRAVAEKYAQLLAEKYVYPKEGAQMAAAIRANIKSGAYNRIDSPNAFAAALAADARKAVNDPHLHVNFGMGAETTGGTRRIVIRHRGSGRQGPGGKAPGVRLSPRMAEQMAHEDGGIREVRILPGNIGYLALNWMAPQDEQGKKAIAAAFALLHDTDALIIDLRGNPGGMGGAELFMSYLSEGAPFVTSVAYWREGDQTRKQVFETTDLGALSYGNKKPVFVLISPRTFSAAEGLAYTIQSFKRGTVVGEASGGGANPTNVGLLSLGYGFSADIPNGYVVNPVTKTNWEGTGVKPNVEIPADEAFGEAWSLAAGRLQANSTNPRTRDLLDALSRAKLEGAASIAGAQLAGHYVSVHGGPQITIVDNAGELSYRQQLPVKADIPLVWRGGNRYRIDGGFSLTFFRRNGKIEVLQVMPQPMQTFVLERGQEGEQRMP
jgi:hypothetical protein